MTVAACVLAVVVCLLLAAAVPGGVGYWFAALRYRADHEARIVVVWNGEKVLSAPLSELARAAARHYEHELVIVRRGPRRDIPSITITLTKAEPQ